MEQARPREQVAELLHEIGWNSPADAQWQRLEQALPRLKVLLRPPINDGGQVYPVCELSQNQATGETVVHQFAPGITLRDHFAAQELVRLGERHCAVNDVPAAYERLAQHCYKMADAMLAARAA